jgi:hypothetical protein
MMRWMLKPIMAPIARNKLFALYEEKDRIAAAIYRAKKSKARVTDLYDLAKQVNTACHKWERWVL